MKNSLFILSLLSLLLASCSDSNSERGPDQSKTTKTTKPEVAEVDTCHGTKGLGLGSVEKSKIQAKLDATTREGEANRELSVIKASARLETAFREVTGKNLIELSAQTCAIESYLNLYAEFFDSQGARKL